jgi:hypothetical protein
MSMIKANNLSYTFTNYMMNTVPYGPLYILFQLLQEPPTEVSFHMAVGLPNINSHLTAFRKLNYVICIIQWGKRIFLAVNFNSNIFKFITFMGMLIN